MPTLCMHALCAPTYTPVLTVLPPACYAVCIHHMHTHTPAPLQSLHVEGRVVVVARSDAELWEALRIMRYARSMLMQVEGCVPMFQVSMRRDVGGGYEI